jgi:hypothetical protein
VNSSSSMASVALDVAFVVLPRRTKMKIAIAASLIAGAAAFAPSKSSKSSTKLDVIPSIENALGAQPPLGFFDPLNLMEEADQERFDKLRAVELKHGRICMLAVVGYLTTMAGVRLPGNISYDGTKFADIPAGWEGSFAVPVAGALQILAFVGYLELAGWKQAEGSFPGDFSASSFPVGWIQDYDEETKLEKRAIELNNGRAAMMGILGLVVHEEIGNLGQIIPV